jgi:hypothetical protein
MQDFCVGLIRHLMNVYIVFLELNLLDGYNDM